MTKTAAEMVAEAKAGIENLSVEQAARELEGGEALIVDIREPDERQASGSIPGAVAAPRGMLEFWADPRDGRRAAGRSRVARSAAPSRLGATQGSMTTVVSTKLGRPGGQRRASEESRSAALSR